MLSKIKVLVVDDSATVRDTLVQLLNQDPGIEVIGTAIDPYEAVAKIAEIVPDVITLDIEIPRMDGLTFLGKLMRQHPIPVVVISSMTGKGSEIGLRALELGACEIITKPRLSTSEQFEEYRIRITDAVKAAALIGRTRIKPRKIKPDGGVHPSVTPSSVVHNAFSEKVILMGASTGGTELISKILKNLRTDLPGILVVQHMPGEFTGAYARRLDNECDLHVKEAENGDVIQQGCVYIANGFNHLLLVKEQGIFKCKLEKGPLVNRHRPSVDVLFHSACEFPGKNIVAAIMTGMGADGARGLLELHEAGAMTMAQDEKSSVIFGMPREAIKLNAAKMIVSPEELVNWLNTTL